MKLNPGIKPALPHIIAVALFIVVSYAYFYPVLEGKVIRANDSTVSTINSKEIIDYRERYGSEPLWTNSIFSGMPAFLITTQYPGNLIKHVDRSLRIFKTPVSMIFLSMAGFYLVLLIFGAGPWVSIAGALAYGLSSFLFLIIAAGHNTQAIALAYMAPMIGGIYYTYRHDVMKGALFTAFIVALEIVANHPQITYYGLICVLVFGIVELIYAIKNKTLTQFLRTTGILVIPFIIAIGINFANLYTIYEYGKYSIRGKSDLVTDNRTMTSGLNRDYITHWSYGIDETFNLLVPDYKGGSAKPFDRNSETVRVLRQNDAAEYAGQLPKYWGTQPGTDGPHYMGAIVIFLFVLGLALVKGPEKWWLLSATILSVMLAWGKNFMFLTDLFIEYFPGYNKFRAVTMALVIAQFCIPLLGFLALRDLFSGNVTKKIVLRSLKIAAGVTGGLLVIMLIFPGMAGSFLSTYEQQYPEWLKNALVSDRKGLLQGDAFRSLIFILLAAGTIIGFIFEKLRKGYAIIIIALLITADLWTAGKRYLNADRFERPSAIQRSFEPTKADSYILEDPSYHRVLNLSVSTFNDNSTTSWFHKSIGGYHGAKLQRYQELIDSVIIDELVLFRDGQTLEDLQAVLDKTPVLSMLNTKYVILSPSYPPLLNPNARGNAWFAEKVVMAGNANEELSALKSFASGGEAIVDVKFRDQITRSEYPVSVNDTIYLVSYKPNELVYRYSAEGERLVTFSEIYYPAGWKSFIDGMETPHLRTNYVLRGMVVPAGEHEIRFSFEPESFYTGNKVSLASSILFILLLAGYLAVTIMKRSKKG
ncbi:MAG: hypothetical protein R6W81_00125 [Bacteroidales bacterium]